MRSNYLLLFSVALLLIISTFVLAQDRENKNKIPPGQEKQKKEKALKDNPSDLKNDRDGTANIEKGKKKNDQDAKGSRTINIKDYSKAKKVTICHNEGDETVTIEVNENALSAHLAHGDEQGECGYDDEGEPDEFIIKNRESRSKFYSAAVEAEDLIALTNRRIEEAKNKLELADQRLTILKSNSDIDEEAIQERTEAMGQVRQLVGELEQLISTTRLKLQQDRQVISQLSID